MTKTISLSEEAYGLLRGLKREGESFSEVTLRIAKRARQEQVLELAGAWNLSDEAAASLKQTVYCTRDESRGPPPEVPP